MTFSPQKSTSPISVSSASESEQGEDSTLQWNVSALEYLIQELVATHEEQTETRNIEIQNLMSISEFPYEFIDLSPSCMCIII